MQELKHSTNISAQQYAEVVEKNEKQMREEVDKKTEQLLKQITIVNPSSKMYTQVEDDKKAKQENFLS